MATAMVANFECQRLFDFQPDASVAEADKGADTRHPPLQLHNSVGFAQLGAGFSSELGEFLLHGQVSAAGYLTLHFCMGPQSDRLAGTAAPLLTLLIIRKKAAMKGCSPERLCILALTEACGDLAQGRDPMDNHEALACGSINASDAGFLQSVAQTVGCQASQAAGATLTLKAASDRCVATKLLFACAGSAHCTSRMRFHALFRETQDSLPVCTLPHRCGPPTHPWCLHLKRLSVEPCRPLQPLHAPASDAAPVGQAQLQQQQQPTWPTASGADAASLTSETPSRLESLVFDAEAAGGSLATPGESRSGSSPPAKHDCICWEVARRRCSLRQDIVHSILGALLLYEMLQHLTQSAGCSFQCTMSLWDYRRASPPSHMSLQWCPCGLCPQHPWRGRITVQTIAI